MEDKKYVKDIINYLTLQCRLNKTAYYCVETEEYR